VLLAGSAGAALVPRPHHPDALARDHGISRATAYRYLDEVIAVLADQAPGLRQALKRAPNGLPLWLSAAEPGSVHDITAGPSKIGDVARAALVLTHFEYGYIT
jgi:hypothetical protein